MLQLEIDGIEHVKGQSVEFGEIDGIRYEKHKSPFFTPKQGDIAILPAREGLLILRFTTDETTQTWIDVAGELGEPVSQEDAQDQDTYTTIESTCEMYLFQAGDHELLNLGNATWFPKEMRKLALGSKHHRYWTSEEREAWMAVIEADEEAYKDVSIGEVLTSSVNEVYLYRAGSGIENILSIPELETSDVSV